MGDDFRRMECCQQECQDKCFKDCYCKDEDNGSNLISVSYTHLYGFQL